MTSDKLLEANRLQRRIKDVQTGLGSLFQITQERGVFNPGDMQCIPADLSPATLEAIHKLAQEDLLAQERKLLADFEAL